MSFFAPNLLWLLLLLPVLPLLYVWTLRRRKVHAVRYTNLALVKEAMAGRAGLRRHIPPLLLFLALAVMTFTLARPAMVLTLPSERSTIVLAIDVSGSMRAEDIQPNRMAVAQAAARNFVADQPRSTRIGVVAFSSSAMITQDPTIAHGDVTAAIDGLYPQRFTAVGSGIISALQAIFPDADIDISALNFVRRTPLPAPLGELKMPEVKKPAMDAVPPGSFTSAVIVLLSDGRTNSGVDPLDAARLAADRGVRVFTVGFGTPEGGIVDFGGGYMRTQLDEETLKAIAEMTGAKYFHATSEADLKKVYNSLTAQFVSETKRTEVSAFAAAAALALMVGAAFLSLMWFGRAA